MKPNVNEYNRALVNELQACIDTGNQGQAETCLALAESYLDDGKINVQQRADLQADFDTAFPDA
ncbi:hypothetical protein D3C77_34680 [compost metagenome]